jgi:hypothetical protein
VISHLWVLTLALWRTKSESGKLLRMDEGRKRVLLIAASILAARKLAQFDGWKKVPATMSAIADAVRWAEEIMKAMSVGLRADDMRCCVGLEIRVEGTISPDRRITVSCPQMPGEARSWSVGPVYPWT